jgi:drug/metabolite transporter (DMT)-like permease
MDKKLFSLGCAVLCSFIWGTGFIAQDMGMDYIGPFTFSAIRLFLGFLTLLPIFLIFEFKKVKKTNLDYKKVFVYFIFISFLLSYGNSLQQFALLLTDVANAAVYTVLYVVIVPFVAYFFFSKQIHWSIWPSVLICIVGGFLLTELSNVSVRTGDAIAVFNAFFWAFHIVFISRFLRIFNFPITIATFQCLIGGIFAFIPAFIFENVSLLNISLEWKELMYAGVLSSGIAFLLQIYAQQNLNPAPVAIIFTLEGVWAAIFGWIILDQYLNEIKIIGILLILTAVIFSQLTTIYGKKKYG